jgi:N-acetyltransferase
MMKAKDATIFELQPTLTGELVVLRPLKAEDWDLLYAAASDPLIWEQHPESTRWQPEVFRRYFDGAMESRGAFAVIEQKSGRIIGSSRYCDLKPEESEVEIGWTFLTREFWGGAHNGEMKRLMIDHALRFLERVVFVVGEKNWRSRKALEKIGAKFWRQESAPAGSEQAKVIYAITRADWK